MNRFLFLLAAVESSNDLLSSLGGRSIQAIPEVLGRQHPSLQVAVLDVAGQGTELLRSLLGQLQDHAGEGALLGRVHLGLVNVGPDLLEVVDDTGGGGGPAREEAAAERIGWRGLAEGEFLGVGWDAGEFLARRPDGIRVTEGNVSNDLGGRRRAHDAEALAGNQTSLAIYPALELAERKQVRETSIYLQQDTAILALGQALT